MKEHEQLKAIKLNSYAIKQIKDPSLQVQLAAVKQNGWVFKWLQDPKAILAFISA